MFDSSSEPSRPAWFSRGRGYRLIYIIRSLMRARSATTYDYNPERVIVFLISRDLYSYLPFLVEKFTTAGVLTRNMFIIDQGTTSEYCKTMYAAYQSKGVNLVSVSKSSETFGPYVPWLDDSIAAMLSQGDYPYIVTDTDLQFPEVYPTDWLKRMFYLLNKHKLFSKISLPLRVTDIDVDNRAEIINHEGGLGTQFIYSLLRILSGVDGALRVCQTDTTCSLYRPGTDFSTISVRLEKDYEMLHMPWYRDYVSTQEYELYRRRKRPEFGSWS